MNATMSTVRYRMRKLSSQIFVAQLAILTATMLVGFVLFAHAERDHLDTQYEARAASIAETVAGVPDIRAAWRPRAGLRRDAPAASRRRIAAADRRVLRRR